MKRRNNRTAGNQAERDIVVELRVLGFTDVVTSRAESRNMDAKKVDIFGESLPIHIQVKNTQMNLKVADYYEENKDIFPKDKPVVIFHKKTKKQKTRFFEQGSFVYMEKETFYSLIKMINK